MTRYGAYADNKKTAANLIVQIFLGEGCLIFLLAEKNKYDYSGGREVQHNRNWLSSLVQFSVSNERDISISLGRLIRRSQSSWLEGLFAWPVSGWVDFLWSLTYMEVFERNVHFPYATLLRRSNDSQVSKGGEWRIGSIFVITGYNTVKLCAQHAS